MARIFKTGNKIVHKKGILGGVEANKPYTFDRYTDDGLKVKELSFPCVSDKDSWELAECYAISGVLKIFASLEDALLFANTLAYSEIIIYKIEKTLTYRKEWKLCETQ